MFVAISFSTTDWRRLKRLHTHCVKSVEFVSVGGGMLVIVFRTRSDVLRNATESEVELVFADREVKHANLLDSK